MLAPELLCNSLCVPLPNILESSGLYESNRHQQPRRRGCQCWQMQDELRFFADELMFDTACVGLLNRVFNTHLIAFLLRSTKQERKSALESFQALCLSRRPRQCILQVSRNTLQQV